MSQFGYCLTRSVAGGKERWKQQCLLVGVCSPKQQVSRWPRPKCLANTKEVKRKHLYSTAPMSLYKHFKVKSTRGLLNYWSCVMKSSLQTPHVLRLSGRDKRPGRKSNVFHRAIIFHPLKPLPVLKKWETRIIASKHCKNSPVSSCNIPAPGSLARLRERLHNSPGWHVAHWFGEGKAWASVSEQREECIGVWSWVLGKRPEGFFSHSFATGNATWDTAWCWALGKQLGCKGPVGHVLGAWFAEVSLSYVTVGGGLTLMPEFLVIAEEDKITADWWCGSRGWWATSFAAEENMLGSWPFPCNHFLWGLF